MVDPDRLFLPRGYSENRAEAVGTGNESGSWTRPANSSPGRQRRSQDPAYCFAARIASRRATVLDVACGDGDNLVRRLSSHGRRIVGVAQSNVVALAAARFPEHEWIAGDLHATELWKALRELSADVVICADVVERVDNPVLLLERLRWLLAADTKLVLSTPDRTRIEDQPPLGPPRNWHHIREWAEPEMRQLLESVGLRVESSRHMFPRRYPLTWLNTKMIAWRALHLRAVPGRRSTMVFQLSRG